MKERWRRRVAETMEGRRRGVRVRPFVFEYGSADVVLRVFNTCVSVCYVSHLSFSRHVFVLL